MGPNSGGPFQRVILVAKTEAGAFREVRSDDDGILTIGAELDIGDIEVDFGTPLTGEVLGAGGVGNLGWLSQINKTLEDNLSGSGLTDAELRATPVPVSGTVAVTGVATQVTLAAILAALSASGLGALAVEMINKLDSTLDSVTVVPGVGATGLGKAEDAVHSSGDVGVMFLAVRKDTAAALATTDGDYQPPITDSSGRLWVNNSGVTQPVSGTVTASNAAGDVAHDGTDSGNPVKIGGKARLTTGAAAVSTANDRVDATFDGQGRLLARTGQQGLVSDLFNLQHTPAVNTQATITQTTPGSGKRLVVTAISATLASDAAPAAVKVGVDVVSDVGGTPVTLWSQVFSIPAVAGASTGIALSGLWLVGTANADMRLRFTAAGGANTYEAVSMSGVIIAE